MGVSLEQYVADQLPPHKKRMYQNVNVRLKKKVLSFKQDRIVQYLPGVAHNYQSTVNF